MSRITPIHASSPLIDRQSYLNWLNPGDIMEDPYSIHDIIMNPNQTSARDRDLLLAHFYERLSYSLIAKRFGYRSKGAAYHAVQRAIRRLRRKVKYPK